MADSFDVDLENKTRPEVIGIRARLMGDQDFQKALVRGQVEARLAVDKISRYLVQNGGGQLNSDEMKITGWEMDTP